MKLMKAMKQLKFWSRKKKRKKDYQYYKLAHDQYCHPCYYPPPPSPPPPLRPAPAKPGPSLGGPCQCHFCDPIEPSAPPLPPWLESAEQGAGEDHYIDIYQETTVKSSSQLQGGDMIMLDESRSSMSYQQNMFPNLEHDLPVVQRRDQAAAAGGLFGCVVDIGDFIFRCFRVSDLRSYHYSKIV